MRHKEDSPGAGGGNLEPWLCMDEAELGMWEWWALGPVLPGSWDTAPKCVPVSAVSLGPG